MKIVLEGISKKSQYTDKELSKIARGLIKKHGAKLERYAVRFCKNGKTELWASGEKDALTVTDYVEL